MRHITATGYKIIAEAYVNSLIGAKLTKKAYNEAKEGFISNLTAHKNLHFNSINANKMRATMKLKEVMNFMRLVDVITSQG